MTFGHLESRKVFVTPSTLHLTEEWMKQQARNVSMWAEDEGIDVRFLIHDHDGKFPESFDEHFARPKGGVVKATVMAPVANCFAESWIGSLKRECLNFFLCFSLGQLDHIVQIHARYHNEFRLHQALGNRPLDIGEDPPPETEEIEAEAVRRQHWLGEAAESLLPSSGVIIRSSHTRHDILVHCRPWTASRPPKRPGV